MKTILVDAWNTFVTEKGINHELHVMLETFPNPKIILTNANEEERKKLGIVDMPYPVFSCDHNPDKVESSYYKKMLRNYSLPIVDVVYFEHNPLAVTSALSVGIKTYWYEKDKNDLIALEQFLKKNV